ncbi:MAG: dihydroorotate dehydrogenase electron transfer subunit [Chloroflexi bacterium]|nr:dihydroorotate dehydrogenase electron transfer subunit [Chloroflexota bacterium]
MIQTRSTVVSNEQLAPDCWRLTLESSRIGAEAKPGQFINIKVSETNDPLFRRPFSVFRRVDLDKGGVGVQVVYRVVGRGTRLMTNLRQGNELDIIGPLGRGFEWRRDKRVHVLLAGGVGAAALFMLGQEISRAAQERGLELHVLLGAETGEKLVLQKEFAGLGGIVQVSTDDGTAGYKGLVTGMLREAISTGRIRTDCAIYSCGPEPMYRALAATCRQYNIPAQICIERHMMCGIGACFACICKVDKATTLKRADIESSHIQFIPEEDYGHALVCRDGPVFAIGEVILD